MTLYLRQVWKDDRLAFATRGNRSVTLNHRQFDRMWTPDVFVRNLKAGVFHTITVPNRLIRLSPDGTILYSQRLTLTLACDMIFSNYPMDNQTCKIELGSCKFCLFTSSKIDFSKKRHLIFVQNLGMCGLICIFFTAIFPRRTLFRKTLPNSFVIVTTKA